MLGILHLEKSEKGYFLQGLCLFEGMDSSERMGVRILEFSGKYMTFFDFLKKSQNINLGSYNDDLKPIFFFIIGRFINFTLTQFISTGMYVLHKEGIS